MRLLFCTSYPYLPEIRGGLQTTVDELCLLLVEKGVEVCVLCGTTDGQQRESDVNLGYRVIRTSDPAAAIGIVAAAFEATTIIVQSSYALSDMLAAALGTGVPVSVYLHNVEQKSTGLLPADPAILYFANSPFSVDRWQTAAGIECHLLPPVVVPGRYVAGKTGNSALFVNPVHLKGVERVAVLAAANPDIPFLITESWTVNDDWRGWVQSRFQGLSNVEWRRPTDDMRPLYEASRLLLMPSVWEEAFGRTAIEAQMNGLPVIGSDRGALVDTIGTGGETIALHAPLAHWTERLRRLYFDHAAWETASQAALENAQKHVFTTSHLVDEALYRLSVHSSR
jgi:glycosyltransferase involved in cell wall biosynthesis